MDGLREALVITVSPASEQDDEDGERGGAGIDVKKIVALRHPDGMPLGDQHFQPVSRRRGVRLGEHVGKLEIGVVIIALREVIDGEEAEISAVEHHALKENDAARGDMDDAKHGQMDGEKEIPGVGNQLAVIGEQLLQLKLRHAPDKHFPDAAPRNPTVFGHIESCTLFVQLIMPLMLVMTDV